MVPLGAHALCFQLAFALQVCLVGLVHVGIQRPNDAQHLQSFRQHLRMFKFSKMSILLNDSNLEGNMLSDLMFSQLHRIGGCML